MRETYEGNVFIHLVRKKNPMYRFSSVIISTFCLLAIEKCESDIDTQAVKNIGRPCKTMNSLQESNCYRQEGFLDQTSPEAKIERFVRNDRDLNCTEREFPFGINNKVEMDKLVKEKLEETGYIDAFDPRRPRDGIIFYNCSSVTEITDQGDCDSCWAVAATDVMTDRLCIKSNGTIKTRYSTADLLSCCEDCRTSLSHTDSCGAGGIHRNAWFYWKNTGIVSGSYENKKGDIVYGCKNYPVKPCTSRNGTKLESGVCSIKSWECPKPETKPKCEEHRKCDNRYKKRSYKEDIMKGEECYHFIRQFDGKEVVLKLEILMHGPVHAYMSLYQSFYSVYSKIGNVSAVDPYKGPQSGENGKEDERCSAHSVRIIGWGKRGEKNYWIVANSYGEHWGDNGFFHLDFNHDTSTENKPIGKEIVYAGIPIIPKFM